MNSQISNSHTLSGKRIVWGIVIIFALAYFPIFSFLTTIPMQIWDESRLAISSMEMSEGGNPFVVTYTHEPDTWSTKPPMMIWLQAIGIKLFGLSEFAVRFPAALAGLFTLFVLAWYGYRISGNYWLPLYFVVTLLSSSGYFDSHGPRTADYDALLTLFITIYSMAMFSFMETGNRKSLTIFFICLTGAVLTKGIAGFMMLPGIFIMLVSQKKIPAILKNTRTYWGIAFFIALAGGYYFLREHFNPGYIKSMWTNEIAQRYMGNVEGHEHPFDYYYLNMYHSRYTFFLPILLCGMVCNFFLKDNMLRKMSAYCTILSITFFLIISQGSSKIEHYELPLYPLFAVITGIFLYSIVSAISKQLDLSFQFSRNLTPYIATFLVFAVPYSQVFSKTFKPVDPDNVEEFYHLGYAMKYVLKHPGQYKHIKVIHSGYDAHIAFYIHMLKNKGVDAEITEIKNIKPNDVVILKDESELTKFNKDLKFTVVNRIKHASIVHIYPETDFANLETIFSSEKKSDYDPSNCNCWKSTERESADKSRNIIFFFNNFDDSPVCTDLAGHVFETESYSKPRSIFTNQAHEYSASLRCDFKRIAGKNLLLIEGMAFSGNASSNAHVVINFIRKNETVQKFSERLFNDAIEPGKWFAFRQLVIIGEVSPDCDEFQVFFHNQESNQVLFDELRITFVNSDDLNQ